MREVPLSALVSVHGIKRCPLRWRNMDGWITKGLLPFLCCERTHAVELSSETTRSITATVEGREYKSFMYTLGLPGQSGVSSQPPWRQPRGK